MANSPGQPIPYYGNSDATAPSNIQFSDPNSSLGHLAFLLGINTNQTGEPTAQTIWAGIR